MSSALSAGRLHILCYHGFERHDECRFRPQLFISAPTFDARLRYLVERGFTVLPLGEALTRLRAGTLPDRAVAITVDDGFKSTLTIATPLFKKHSLPATVYVTTYYVDQNVPIFRLAVQYLFWMAQRDSVDLAGPIAAMTAAQAAKDSGRGNDGLMWSIIRYGEALPSEAERQALLAELSTRTGIDLKNMRDAELLTLMSRDDVRALADAGIDVQLHTHRHRFPIADEQAARREIQENRARLEEITGRDAPHFCYPSGIFATSQWPWLESLGIASATTCLPGSNDPHTPIYGLRRFLDSEDVRFIEYRAELAGFNDLLRKLKRLRGTQAVDTTMVRSGA